MSPRLTWDVYLPFYQRLCISFPRATSSQEDQCPSRDLPPCSKLQLYAEIIDSAIKEMHLCDFLFCAWVVKWLTAISMLKGLLWTLAVHGVICVTKSWCRGAGIKLACDMKEARSDSIMWMAEKKQGKSDAWCLDDQSVCMEIVCFQALFLEVHVGGSCPLLILKFYHQYLPQCWPWWKYYLMQEYYSTEHVNN